MYINDENIISLINDLKKGNDISLNEKISIFNRIYNIPTTEKHESISMLLGMIVYEFGHPPSFSDEENKKSFLNIYGEPKNKQINTLEDILDIVLGEIKMRNELKLIFSEETQSYLTPYVKENSIEFLSMKKLNIYTTRSFQLEIIICKKSSYNFPLNEEILEDLSNLDEYTDYIIPVIDRIKGAEIYYRAEHTYSFIKWFNSRFWNEKFGQVEFSDDSELFEKAFTFFKENAIVSLCISEKNIDLSEPGKLTITGGKLLSVIGQKYLCSLHPLNLTQFKNINFV